MKYMSILINGIKMKIRTTMNENLNLVEILKDCPKGTKLYSTIYGEVELDKIDIYSNHPIRVLFNNEDDSFTEDGRLFFNCNGECVLFPSKDQRDWSKFKIKKPKFDPKTLKPFDKVLVKIGTKSYHMWFPDFISLPPNDIDKTVLCMTTDDVVMAIPYNEETKSIAGTNKEAPEFYRYWETYKQD